MNEIKRSEIIYEEGWRDASPLVDTEEESPLDEAVPQEEEPRKKSKESRPLLITLQLVFSLLAALVLFLLKAMDSAGYHNFMAFYREELEKPVISQEVFHFADVSKLFDQNAVTVRATPDETSDSED